VLDQILERFTSVDHRHISPRHHNQIMGKPISDPDVNKKLYTGILPPSLVKNKTVLDLGSFAFLSGAWSLYHGAKHVTGVEINKTRNKIANDTMSEFFDSNWKTVEQSIETFISNNNEQYDVILIAGTLHKILDKTNLLLWCTEHSDYVILESNYPPVYQYLLGKEQWWNDIDNEVYNTIYGNQDKQFISNLLESEVYGEWFLDFLKNKLPVYQYAQMTNKITHAKPMYGNSNASTYTSPNYFKHFFSLKGWDYDNQHSEYLSQTLPEYYTFPRRYCIGFSKGNG